MNPKKLSDCIENSDNRLVQQAQQIPNYAQQHRKKRLRSWTAIAACFALMACTIIVVYANEEGEMLKFSYSHNPDNTTWFVGADSLTVQPITINGISGEAITSTEQGAATAIMWITTENTAFNISGFLSVEDLIAMAESVQIIKP